jgi:nitronate monooxygenase
MPIETILTRRLGLVHPIIQAPMGGATTVDLTVAACEAGALGFIAAAYLTPAQIRETAAAVRARTARPFGINLFAPVPAQSVPDAALATRALERLAAYHAELGLPLPALPDATANTFDAQMEAVVDSRAAVFSFTFGIPPQAGLQAARSRGMFIAGTATTVTEAKLLQDAGADAIVAQGSEAGAHRGTFAGDFASAMIGTMALVPQIADAVPQLPVIASGGIMDGRGLAAALALGAAAVQMGTAFLTCPEAGVPEVHKAAILAATEDQTRVTRVFSGRPARGIINRFMIEVETGADGDPILPYPLQNALTRPLRTAAAKQGRPEFLSLWAGQGLRLGRREPAAVLVERVSAEAQAVLRRLAQP